MKSIIEIIIGFILVIIFMLYKYKIFGLVANIALVANLIMLGGILTILEATLTLPGIAGIILTVGMAVDANVLIFERIKEEAKNEKNNIIAFDAGYNRSKTAVIDANITTLISAVILFVFGPKLYCAGSHVVLILISLSATPKIFPFTGSCKL